MRNSNTERPRRGSFGNRRFYISYIERLIQRRAERGEPPAPENCSEQYWIDWRKNNQIEPSKKAA
jgi:hypothetical protein